MSETHHLLLKQIGAGDKQALAALYQAYERPVYKFIVSRLNDPHEASDILHDVFMDIWRVAGSFEGRSQVKTWIFGIAYRKVIDVHRKRARVTITDEVPEPDDLQDAADASYGAKQPIASSDTEEGKSMNRRVYGIATADFDSEEEMFMNRRVYEVATEPKD